MGSSELAGSQLINLSQSAISDVLLQFGLGHP